ncbi:RICIN domain-containing protein [Oligoflexus tunisiensis]|uniref:RICIN domain-containing protein n=1 Tax=Oligoflexus tunisiensis TaxID=708132 RepID=UPI00114C99D9|nr:ricin-type beta-trefoil lectin domain protein [Oligoflexus tunisiensis]
MKNFPRRALWVAGTTLLFACRSPTRTPQIEVGNKDLSKTPTEESSRLDDLEEQNQEQSQQISEALGAIAEKDSKISANEQIISQKDKEIQDLKNMDASEDKLTEEEKKSLKEQIEKLENEKNILADKTKKLEDEKNKLEAQIKASNATSTPGTAPSTTGYYFVTFQGGRCLDVDSSSVAENSRILGFPCQTPGLNQQFLYTEGQNFFQLRSRTSAKCISISANSLGSAIVQKTCDLYMDKTWEPILVGTNQAKFRNRLSQKCMGVSTANTMILVECNSNFPVTFTWSPAR